MKIDVLIPVFRDLRVIEAIQSVFDCDRDGVVLRVILQIGDSGPSFQSKVRSHFPQVEIYSDVDRNIFDAINIGLKKCRGDYILTLGSDDRICDKGLFQKLKPFYEKSADYIFCGLEYTDDVWRVKRRWPAATLRLWRYYLGWQYPHFAFFCSPRVYSELNFFNSKNDTNADYEFFWKLAKKRKSSEFKEGILYEYGIQMRLGGNSSSGLARIAGHNVRLLKFAYRTNLLLLPAISMLKWFHKISEYLRAKL